ncbi:Oxidoreductase [Lasiodiplodia theobromae]|uniref:Retinol dehydrogenase 12 n=1 Tax=Lasiodiplodia theobromae TaxID=45133 RepID=A0A5N5CWJ9_9PEZI|nr:Oxidoreductase [Lasiodiplodia theobromae]KAB2569735.1 Retinol dehydrogenase 12 [Lasiodiplodia theobromae]KAF4539156.1 Oxidoreductase [Lasiodiplodia theobromae]
MPSQYAAAYANPQGAGDARPTADQIIQDEGVAGQWKGRVILITGASAGIGIETARALAKTGATLYLAQRSPDKTKAALGDLLASGQAHLLHLEMESLESVRQCASEFLSKETKLHVLICNAGVMMTPEGRTVDGFETQIGVNHLAHFLLIQLLKDALIAASTPDFNSRLIILSSSAHRDGEVDFKNINLEGAYDPFKAYTASKTACVWTANHFERLYGSKGVHAWSVNPSVVRTSLGRFMGEENIAAAFENEEVVKENRSVPQGAAPTVWAATAKQLEGKPGQYVENCDIPGPWDRQTGHYGPGYCEWTYDEEKERRLWALSMQMVGLA